mmetsp:Transcript_3525/g.10994  ORF Transcript_3525/g.10994 Transcript_3525/m.10994 type:complete len:136 (-) Transcript_3525:6-413(-)
MNAGPPPADAEETCRPSMLLATPLPADVLGLLADGAWTLAPPPRIDVVDGATRLAFDELVLWWRQTAVPLPPLAAAARAVEQSAGVDRSNVGGFHSHADIFDALPRATRDARAAAEALAARVGVVSARGGAPRPR